MIKINFQQANNLWAFTALAIVVKTFCSAIATYDPEAGWRLRLQKNLGNIDIKLRIFSSRHRQEFLKLNFKQVKRNLSRA